jgi:hypothetical protein
MPDPEQTTPAAASAEPWKELGFDDPAKAIEALKTYKTDLAALKAKNKELTPALAELEALRKEKAERDEATKTETQKALDKAAALEKRILDMEAQVRARDQSILYERALAQRLPTLPEEVREAIRDSFDKAAAVGFADDKELTELLDAAQKKWEPIIARISGQGGGMGIGVSRGVPPTPARPGSNPYADVMGRDLSALQRDARNERR